MSIGAKKALLFLIVFCGSSYADINLRRNLLRQGQMLELDRILSAYSLQAERGLFFEGFELGPDEIIVEELDPLGSLDSNEMRVEYLDLLDPHEASIKRGSLKKKFDKSFADLLEKEKIFLEKKEEFKEFLSLYDFLQRLKPYFYTLKELQAQIDESFSSLNKVVMQSNQIDKKAEEFEERYKILADQRGSLNFVEIERLIEFNREKLIFSESESFKAALDQTIVYIRSLYGQIDSEKERLLSLGHPLAAILCGSSFYKSSRPGCLTVFQLQNKEELDFFIDSLNPEKWRELEIKTQERVEYSNRWTESSFKESLWLLAQENDFNKMKTLFKTADFFRWIYFNLREELAGGADPDLLFSWVLIEEKMKEEKKEKQRIESESILFSLNKKEMGLKRILYSNNMEEKEEEYFFSLIAASSVIGSNLSSLEEGFLEGTDISCLKSELKTTSEWSACINQYFNLLAVQENLQKNLKEPWEKELNQSLKELVFIAFSLKKQLENHLN